MLDTLLAIVIIIYYFDFRMSRFWSRKNRNDNFFSDGQFQLAIWQSGLRLQQQIWYGQFNRLIHPFLLPLYYWTHFSRLKRRDGGIIFFQRNRTFGASGKNGVYSFDRVISQIDHTVNLFRYSRKTFLRYQSNLFRETRRRGQTNRRLLAFIHTNKN